MTNTETSQPGHSVYVTHSFGIVTLIGEKFIFHQLYHCTLKQGPDSNSNSGPRLLQCALNQAQMLKYILIEPSF